MKIFVSWSMPRSKHLSEIFSKFLPAILQNIEVFVSHSDLDAGVDWNLELNRQLESTNFGIICVTPENQNQNWIHFEAGKLSKRLDDATRLIPVCFDMKLSQLVSPLSQFQAKEFDIGNVESIFKSICRASDKQLPLEFFDMLFDKFKKDIVKHIKDTPKLDEKDKPEERSGESMLEEVLLLLRRQSQSASNQPASEISQTGEPVDSLTRVRTYLLDSKKSIKSERRYAASYQARQIIRQLDSSYPDPHYDQLISLINAGRLDMALELIDDLLI